MSQVNIQNLLSLNPVEPTQAATTPVNYTSAQFQGGEFRPGQLAQLPRSSEEVMFSNLSQIAGGAGQALQTFGNIASQIDRDRINKVEAEWERIDAQDIDPRDKTKEFDKIVSSVATPITGDTWKKRIAAKVSKSWGKEAFEKYVETQFNEQAKQWPKYDGKMGPITTQEFLTEFNIKNPSLTGSDFITAMSMRTQAQLREQEDTIVANNLVLVQENDYSLSDEQINGLANKTLDISEVNKTSPKVVKLLELAASSATQDDFNAKMTQEFYAELNPVISGLDPEVQYNVTLRLDQFRSNLAGKLWRANTVIRSGNNLFRMQGNVNSALSTFSVSPNDDSLYTLADQSLLLLPDIPTAQQKPYLDQVVGAIYNGLASNEWGGYAGFRDLPVQDQFKILETKIREAFPEDALEPLVKDGAFHGDIYKELINFFKVSKTGLELKANISTTADQLVKSLSAQATLNDAFGRPTNTPALLTNFVVEFAKKTGISEEIWKAVLFDESKDEQGNTIFTITADLPSEILKDEKIRQSLATIGYGETELGGLFTIVSGLVKGQGGRGGGGGGTPSLDVQKYATVTSATAALLTKPGLSTAVQQAGPVSTDDATGREIATVRQAMLNLDSQTRTLFAISTYAYMQSQMSNNDQQNFKRGQEAKNRVLNGVAIKNDINLSNWFDETYGLESPAFKNASETLYGVSIDKTGFFEFENGQELNPLSDENLRNRENWVDENGTITPEGRLLGLRLMVRSQAWAQQGMSNETGFSDYIKSLKEQVDALASGDLRTADQALLYRTLYALKGLKAGDSPVIGLGSSMGETDNIYFHNLLDFLSTAEIPSNPQQIDAKTKTFMNAFNIAIETMGLSQNLGVLYGLSGYSDNPKDAATSIIGAFSSGDYTAILPKDTESNGTNATIRLGQFFRFPGLGTGEDKEKADKVLSIFYEMSSGLLPTSRGPKGEILGLPSPTETSDFYVDIPTKDGTQSILWSKTTHDQKMTFYFSRLFSLAKPNLISSLAYPAAAAQVLSQNETFGNDADRIKGLQILMSAGNEYKRRRNNNGSVNVPTVTWKGTSTFMARFDPFVSDWNLSRNYNSAVPQIDTNNPNLQPQNLVQGVLNLTFENGNIPNFNELETQMQIQDPRDWPVSWGKETITGEQLVEELANDIYGTSEEARIGIAKGLDPADQFVLGVASMPARKESMDYFFSVMGLVNTDGKPITSESLLANLGPQNRKDLESILTTRTDTGVLTVIERYFPHLMEPIQQRILQFNLGEGQSNKVRFNKSMDGTSPVLEFSVPDQPYNVFAIQLGELPKLPEVSFPTAMQKTEGSIRWVNAFKTIRDMQNKSFVDTLDNNPIQLEQMGPPTEDIIAFVGDQTQKLKELDRQIALQMSGPYVRSDSPIRIIELKVEKQKIMTNIENSRTVKTVYTTEDLPTLESQLKELDKDIKKVKGSKLFGVEKRQDLLLVELNKIKETLIKRLETAKTTTPEPIDSTASTVVSQRNSNLVQKDVERVTAALELTKRQIEGMRQSMAVKGTSTTQKEITMKSIRTYGEKYKKLKQQLENLQKELGEGK